MSSPQPEHGNEPGSPERSIVHRLFRHGPTPEERLAELIDVHRRDLDEHRARFEQTLEDLERRERLLSDAKASVERLLRLGSKDLDAREEDISRLVRELTEREERLRDEEADVEQRRTEVGAVELKRVRVEQRERALEEREARMAVEERTVTSASHDEVALAFVPGASYRLVELAGGDLAHGAEVTIEGQAYAIARVGPSPFPGDRRRCAYLVRGPRGLESPGGSS